MNSGKTYIFVYNANSGKLNAYLDTLHKLISPKTYPCSLCDITYGYWGIKEEWAEFLESFPHSTRFLHKDEWEEEFSRKDQLPAVFLKDEKGLSTFISSEEMNRFSLSELKKQIIRRL